MTFSTCAGEVYILDKGKERRYTREKLLSLVKNEKNSEKRQVWEWSLHLIEMVTGETIEPAPPLVTEQPGSAEQLSLFDEI